MRKLNGLKDTKKGRCYVFGNAPSLMELNLDCYMGLEAFWCNKAFNIPNFDPYYYIVSDPNSLKDYKEIAEKIRAPMKFFRKDAASLINAPDDFYFKRRKEGFMHDGDFGVKKNTLARGHTVVLDAIQIADYMGYDEIMVGGVDLTNGYVWDTQDHTTDLLVDLIIKSFKVAKANLEKRGKKLKKITTSPNLPLDLYHE